MIDAHYAVFFVNYLIINQYGSMRFALVINALLRAAVAMMER